MDAILFPLLVLFTATWAGGMTSLLVRAHGERSSKLFLSFSGALLFGLILDRFLPELFRNAPSGIGTWVLGGFFLQLLLDLISGGIEHGHVQGEQGVRKRLPYALLLGLSFHAFLESVPLGTELLRKEGPLLIGLVVHKLPVSLALASLLLNSGSGRGKALLAFGFFSLMAPLGIIIGHFLPAFLGDLAPQFSYYLLAVVLGIILHVSTTILFESSEGHRFETMKLSAVLAGFALTLFLG